MPGRKYSPCGKHNRSLAQPEAPLELRQLDIVCWTVSMAIGRHKRCASVEVPSQTRRVALELSRALESTYMDFSVAALWIVCA